MNMGLFDQNLRDDGGSMGRQWFFSNGLILVLHSHVVVVFELFRWLQKAVASTRPSNPHPMANTVSSMGKIVFRYKMTCKCCCEMDCSWRMSTILRIRRLERRKSAQRRRPKPEKNPSYQTREAFCKGLLQQQQQQK